MRRSTGRGPCHSPLRSALRVWLPSRRLTPSAPVPAFFHTGGAPGIRPSELSPLGRYPPRFRAEAPTRRFSRRFLPPRSGGPAQRAAASGLLPFRESLAPATGLVWPAPDAPLGFALSGFTAEALCEVHPHSSLALSASRACDRLAGAPEFRSASTSPHPQTANRLSDEATLTGFSHRVPRAVRAAAVRAIFFTSRRVVHYCRLPTLLGRSTLCRSRSGEA